MSAAWIFSVAALLNLASLVLVVYTVRERRRIEDIRKRLRLDRLADSRRQQRPADVIHVPFARSEP